SNQIWFVSFPEGEARKLTNDLNDYSSLGVSPDGKLVVSVQATQTSSLWVGEAGNNSSGFKQIASETGFLSPIDLTSDDRLIFRSNADGKSNLWTMRTDGGERRQLTADAQADMRGICVTPDAKRIVFVSSLAGKYDLWRVDVDGENLTRLTSGDGEMFPACSPDNQFIIYQKSLRAGIGKALWKIPLNGGQQIPLTDYYAIRPAISPDGRRVAFFYMSDEKWRIGIVSANGGLIEQSFDVPDNVPDRIIRWAQNNRDLFYAANIGDIGNVWQLSPDGKTKQITDFDSNLLDAFALSPNAKKMAITRTTTVSDVVGIAEQP
ncbi:MAG: TolB family protein, partial [Pyrinomonadaceae bacterium]